MNVAPHDLPADITIVDALIARAERTPDALAFDVAGRRLSYATLRTEACKAAAALLARGLSPGDRVVLVLGTVPELIALIYGAQLARLVPMVINPSIPRDAIARRVTLVGAALIIDGDNVADFFTSDAALPSPLPSPDDLAYLQLTSGTTGEPHAAMVHHRSLVASLEGSCLLLCPTASDALASWVPIHHDLGLVRFVFLPIYLGRPCHLLQPSLVNLRAWLVTIARERATITGAPDFAYRLAARTVDASGLDLSCLRVATNGGEPVRRSTIEAFERRFALPGVVRPGYGLAEATLGVASIRPGAPLRFDAAGHVSCGPALDGIEVRVVDGAIEARGAAIFSGYFGDADATAAAFTDDGWLRTGDAGYLDDDGHLFVLARTRAMIKRAGALIAPREVEEAADRVDGVRFSAAVGLPREHDGTEDIVVVVEARPEALEGEARSALIRAVSDEVATAIGFAPGDVIVAPPRTIPITANGKIRHSVLRAELLARLSAPS